MIATVLLAERYLRWRYGMSRPSVVCLSSVTLLRPTRGLKFFAIFLHRLVA